MRAMHSWTRRITPGLALAFALVAIGAATRVIAVEEPIASLWNAPTDLAARDLFAGPWGADAAPDPHATYTFLRPKKGGVNPGVVVRDEQGRVWHVKQPPHNSQGAEGPVEVVLSRVLAAVGYHQPPVYFLPSFTLRDASGVRTEAGGRFRLDDRTLRSVGTWSWHRNPFVGTQPYNGLLVILLMFNSWDLKDSNNTLYERRSADGRVERWYVVRDLGAALGETGRLAPKRNNIDRFERARFISNVDRDGFVSFTYHGWQPGLLHHTITRDDVRWAAALVGGLSDRQWRDAFRAGGYPEDLAARFIAKIDANVGAAAGVRYCAG